MAIPTANSQWIIQPSQGLDSLRMQRNTAIEELGETSCLVKIEAITLNYRDVALPTGRYPMASKETLIPCSDGTGSIVAVGSMVNLHRVGDRVCPLFYQGYQSGFMDSEIRKTSLGSRLDGVLREYAVFDQTGLVSAPASLTLKECATLPCAAVTAWNALTGISGRSVRPNDYVLVQGTGGVSLFAAQFALAKGAIVIAATSSEEKEKRLREMGVQHVVNYKQDEKWGETAKKLTPDGEGVQHVIEVGGETTMEQSLKAVRYDGVISIIGFLGGKAEEQRCSFSDCLLTMSIVRGVNVGSKEQFIEMNAFIEEHRIKPLIDDKIFGFQEVREAYQYVLDAKHWGKVVIDVGGNNSA